MKVIQFTEYGDPQVLQLADAPLPMPGVGAVRIKVAAAGVNPADYKWRQGMFRETVPVPLPHVLGYDVAGTIDEIGEGVEGFSVGDRVGAMLSPFAKGGYAEFVAIDAANVAKIPEGLDFNAAAALPTPALAGVQLIAEHVRPEPGQTVLITGAVGAVGRFAMHTARELGARVVAAVLESQLETARSLGADEAIVLGADASADVRIDHVADVVGGDAVAAICRLLPASGRIRTVATTPINPDGLQSTPTFIAVHPDGAALASIYALVADGKVTVAPVRTMPLAQAADAHRLVETGTLQEKIILNP